MGTPVVSQASYTSVSLSKLRSHSDCYSCFPAVSSWKPSVGAGDYANALQSLGTSDEPLALYVHLPFCSLRCQYCGGHAVVTHNPADIDAYLDHLEMEMDLVFGLLGSKRPVIQLHVGGGTPNYLNESQLARLTHAVESRFNILGEADVSIECDLRKVSAGQLATLHTLGFRRINFGVPALDAETQKAIGRVQSPDMVSDAYWNARDAGFECVSIDLIHGLPAQTLDSFMSTVEKVVELGPDRIACLCYAHEPAERPHQRMIDEQQLPAQSDCRRMFESAVERLTDAGYTWIGFNRFSLAQDELAIAASERRLWRNFMGYKSSPGSQVVSFGISGLSEINGTLVQNDTYIPSWKAALNEKRLPVIRGRKLDPLEARRRNAIIHLICNLEVPAALAQGGLEDAYERLGRLAKDGLVEITDHAVRVTPLGHHFLRDLCDEFGAASEAVHA